MATPATYTYAFNTHGDVIGLVDKDNAKVVEYKYDAWGNITSSTGSVTTGDGELLRKANPFRYASYQYDEETGFYYLKARYYAALLPVIPSIGYIR